MKYGGSRNLMGGNEECNEWRGMKGRVIIPWGEKGEGEKRTEGQTPGSLLVES